MRGSETAAAGEVQIETAMSMSLDLPDADYDWIQFSGAWARERYVKERKLQQGIQSVGSLRGRLRPYAQSVCSAEAAHSR